MYHTIILQFYTFFSTFFCHTFPLTNLLIIECWTYLEQGMDMT